MDQPVRLYSFADVDRSGKVRWTACELGLAIEETRLEFGQHLDEDYLELNPYGQIPTLEAGGEVLIESNAICMLLAERHPDSGLIPEQKAQRARFWQATSVTTTTLEQPVVNYFLSKTGLMDERWRDLLKTSLEQKLSVLADAVPEEGYICDQFTLADIFAGYVLRLGVQAGLLAFEGRLAQYLDRLRTRPAAIKSRVFDSLDT